MVGDQVLRLTAHDFTKPPQGVGGNGTVVTDALKRLWVQPLIGQIVVGDAVLFHISPHRFKRHWHEITATLLSGPCIFDYSDSNHAIEGSEK